MKAKLEKVDRLLVETIKKIDLGMPFSAQKDVFDARKLVRDVLVEEFPDKYSRDNW